jgi:SAM-dependent methyltransferase
MVVKAPSGKMADELGKFDLDELDRARRLRSWMFEQYEARAHGRAVEIGPGLGAFSERLLANGVSRLHLVEPDAAFARVLERRFGRDPKVTLAQEGLPEAPSLRDRGSKWDFILCQNVLEHVEDDRAAVETMAAALRAGGGLTLVVPAGPRLYGSLDRSYGHHRRYTAALVRELIDGAGLELVSLHAFNLLGVVGWWAKSLAGASSLGSRSLRAYELMLPLWRPIERRLAPPHGLSLIAHARR